MPTADGSADQVLKTDGSGTLSFTDQSAGTVNPAEELGSDTDSGTASSATQDAFGHQTSSLTELDLLTKAENALGTVDLGALS